MGWSSRLVVGSRIVSWICSWTPGAMVGELVFWLAYQRSARVAAGTTMQSVFPGSRSAG
jgi:hypothetical protein